MPFEINLENVTQQASLSDVVDYFSSCSNVDRDTLTNGAHVLKSLANNERFLSEIITQEVKLLCKNQINNPYSGQSYLLHRGEKFFIRAAFWPCVKNNLFINNGAETFFYDVPHDHNFDFLTVGYSGPGYASDFYEYDADSRIGFNGEHINTKYVGRHILEKGKIILYRKSFDIHSQLAPEDFSISLNIITDNHRELLETPQLMMNREITECEYISNRSSIIHLCNMALALGAESTEIIEEISQKHRLEWVRFSAYDALAGSDTNIAEKVWEKASRDSSSKIREIARKTLNCISGDLGK
ncbi:hypothetical protein AA0312_2350 [Acetobacter tropicalis NRIC 0312]|uniref:Uncharacterized protein n=1 Tax=Acetobacter tropicalis TaxID=104102 RepID=A0A511FSH5_9PROT|nr:hypothetical protein [Acetobacter tropicalis]GAL96047.1 transposase [Acetobacter tropicalis]GBR71524.1 hypothetical protein AA0312_2350 [Acetobacter tropicalis NRIC 0312]GEL51893.1 hypothetical protein ATR01nite_29680 [Acetobacter tropicalis]